MLTISVAPYEISKVTFFHLIFYPSWLKENQTDERVLLTLSTSPLASQNGKDILLLRMIRMMKIRRYGVEYTNQ
jgi:hypothetical protein